MRTAMKGFEATGIWPVNIGLFTDADFLPSAPTDRTIECNESTNSTSPDDPAITQLLTSVTNCLKFGSAPENFIEGSGSKDQEMCAKQRVCHQLHPHFLMLLRNKLSQFKRSHHQQNRGPRIEKRVAL